MKNALFLALVVSANAHAEDFPPSADFGSDFGSAVSAFDKQQTEHDRAEIGGRLRIEATTIFSDKQKIENAATTNGSGAEIYIDAKGENGSRALLRAQIKQSAENTNPAVSVDEAKVQFTAAQKLFFTGGRQKVKFGAAKFFNPTDFPNQELRDPFALDDRRPGVDALKIHIPGEGYNLYAMALSPQSKKLGDVGAYWRGELAFSKGEVSVSGLEVRGEHTRLGADASVAVGDLDLFSEYAWGGKSRVSSGVTYELNINDTDSISLVGEYHFNENGLTNRAEYYAALKSGTHRPLELAREYFAASAYLAKPKIMSKTTFLASIVNNLSDQSYVIVPQVFHEITKDLTASVNVQILGGSVGSEFKLGRARAQTTIALEAVF